MKTLRVCLSSELPDLLHRSSDYLYFAYDKLNLYNGKNIISDNYVIASAIPESQVTGMIYILDTDGSVHRKLDYSDEKIAEIEDGSQIDLLKKAGTMFYVNADHRYIDSQRRSLTLPFNDGTYELNVSAKNDAVYDNNTILKFNENTNRFEMYSDTSEEFIDYSKPLRGATTPTVEMTVSGPRLYGNIRISEIAGNILRKASDGLYIKTDNYLPRDEFMQWQDETSDFRKYALAVLQELDEKLDEVKDLVTREAIMNDILEQLESKYPEIETGLDAYDDIKASMDAIETDLMNYAEGELSDLRNTLVTTLEQNSEWEELDDSHTEFAHEIDYYKKAEAYFYPSIPKEERRAIIGSAIAKYLADNPVSDQKKIIIATAIAQYMADIEKEKEEKERQEKAIISMAIAQYISDNQ